MDNSIAKIHTAFLLSKPNIKMASYGTTTHRAAATSAPPSSAPTGDRKGSTALKNGKGFTLICPFNIPSTPEAAALRIIKNLGHFGLYYVIFVWLILYISLIPQRKVSLVYFVTTTVVTCLYLLLLREFPNSLLHKIIDKRFVLFLVAILMAVELILTRAAIHLFVTLAAALPVILVHAVLWGREDLVVNEEANYVGELAPLVHGGDGDDAADASV